MPSPRSAVAALGLLLLVACSHAPPGRSLALIGVLPEGFQPAGNLRLRIAVAALR